MKGYLISKANHYLSIGEFSYLRKHSYCMALLIQFITDLSCDLLRPLILYLKRVILHHFLFIPILDNLIRDEELKSLKKIRLMKSPRYLKNCVLAVFRSRTGFQKVVNQMFVKTY